MLKGIPMKNRDSKWHKRNDKKRAKDKKRRAEQGDRKLNRINRMKVNEAEQRYQEAYMREQRLSGRDLTIWRRLWLRFISNYFIIKIRKVAHYFKRNVRS